MSMGADVKRKGSLDRTTHLPSLDISGKTVTEVECDVTGTSSHFNAARHGDEDELCQPEIRYSMRSSMSSDASINDNFILCLEVSGSSCYFNDARQRNEDEATMTQIRY